MVSHPCSGQTDVAKSVRGKGGVGRGLHNYNLSPQGGGRPIYIMTRSGCSLVRGAFHKNVL